jgi:hypothetical protein
MGTNLADEPPAFIFRAGNPESGGNCFVQNVDMYLPEYMMSYQTNHGHKCRKFSLFASL